MVQPVINVIRAWTCKLKLRFQLLVQQVDKFTNNVIREILKSDQFLKLARKEIFDIALEPLRYFLKEIKIWLIKNKTKKKLPLTIFTASLIHWFLYVTDLSIHHLSLYPSVCRRKKKHQFTSLRRHRQETILIWNRSTFFIFVFFLI